MGRVLIDKKLISGVIKCWPAGHSAGWQDADAEPPAGWLQLICVVSVHLLVPRDYTTPGHPLVTDLRNLQTGTLIKVFHLALGSDKSLHAD